MNRLVAWAAAGAGAYLLYRATRPGYDFRGKTVLVTGGSRGLGLVLARELVNRGARVAICARSPEELDRAAFDLRQRGGRVLPVPCDLTDPDQVRRTVAEVERTLGPIDVLINNAGVIGVGPMEEMRHEDYELSLKVHLWACLYTVEAVLPGMKARGAGRIVNISSIGGKIAVPHLLPYTAGKFALVGFSNGLRAEVKRHGVVVTTVCPGLMRTGSPWNAEFKGRHEEEYAWFVIGDSVPGFSMNAVRAARKVLAACARGDAEVVLSLPAKLAVAAQGLFPTLTADVLALVNHHVLPEPGGVGPRRIKGRDSRGKTPEVITTLTDRAAADNNELGPAPPATASVTSGG